MEGKLFYSYNDKYGHGINPEYLITYSESVIFDNQNRTLYANGNTVGNHMSGTYHGEIFNDFVNNEATGKYAHAEGKDTHALGDASSAHGIGTRVAVTNEAGAVFGKYNKTTGYLFTIGNGDSFSNTSDAVNVDRAGNLFIPKADGLFVGDRQVFSYIDNSYNYMRDSYNNLHAYTLSTYNDVKTAYNFLEARHINAYSYTTYQAAYIHNYIDSSYSYTLDRVNYFNNAYSYCGDRLANIGAFGVDILQNTQNPNEAKLYIWRGTSDQLNGLTRYANVLYIVTDTLPTGEIYKP